MIRFVYYLREFTQLDLVIRGITEDPQAPKEPSRQIAFLDDKLSRLKAQMIEEFADTNLYREGAMTTVMALISDARAGLAARLAKAEDRLEGDAKAMSADRNVFRLLSTRYKGNATGRATCYYRMDPHDGLHPSRERMIREKAKASAGG